MRADTIIRASRWDPAVIFASLGANLLSLVLPMSMIHLYDRIIPNNGYETLSVLAIVVVASIVAEAMLRSARRTIVENASERFEMLAYRAAFASIMKAAPSHGDVMTRGRLSRGMASIENLRAMHTSDTALAIMDLPFAMLFLAVIAVISPAAGLIVFATLLVTFAILRIARRRVRELQDARKDLEEKRHSFLTEVLSGIENVKSMHIERAMCRRYERLMQGAATVGSETVKNTHLAQGYAATVGAFAPVLVACSGAFLVIDGEMSIGALAAIILLTGRIIQPALKVEAFLAGMAASGQEREDLEDILSIPLIQSGKRLLHSINSLELREVTTSPQPHTGHIFERVSMKVERGDCCLVVGPSRRDCASFLHLLLGEARLESGSILINGRDISDYDLGDRQAAIRYLSRDCAPLTGTLMDNLTGFREREFRDDALRLARVLGIDHSIAQSADGYDLRMGIGAKVGLSKSLSDTVLIIGGLVSAPGLVLFDEANASLDRGTDTRLLKLMEEDNKDRITFLYTNRPSYKRLANKTIDITPFVKRSANETSRV